MKWSDEDTNTYQALLIKQHLDSNLKGNWWSLIILIFWMINSEGTTRSRGNKTPKYNIHKDTLNKNCKEKGKNHNVD